MSKFQDNLRVIPRAAKVTAWIVSLSFALAIGFLVTCPPDGKPVPLAAKILMPFFMFAVAFVYIHLIGYVNGDGRDYVIAVLTDGSTSEAAGIATIEGLSTLIWQELAPATT